MRRVLGCLVLAALSACAVSTPAPRLPDAARSEAGLRGQLLPGQTTRDQVAAALGKGSATTFDNGFEVWVYDDKHAIPELLRWLPVVGNAVSVVEATSKVHELAILFDRDGIVRKYQLRERSSAVMQALNR
jgi:outer membrane protein assembly factor BamE (lipoprotein component of BamABCDE complex)